MTLRTRILIAYACDPVGVFVRGAAWGALAVASLACLIRGC